MACPVISGASNGPSGCLQDDECSTKLPVENFISLKSCDMQLSNSIHYIFVTSGYQSKQPVLCSPVHEMNHPAVCDMMSDPPSFIMKMLDH